MKTFLLKAITLSLPFLFYGVLIGVINIFHLFFIICFSLFLLNVNEAAIVLVLAVNTIAGLIVPIFGLPIPGALITLVIALLLLNVRIIELVKKYNKKSLTYILVSVGVFTLYYLFSGRGENATIKIVDLYLTTIMTSIAFLILVSSKDIDLKRISIIFILVAIFQIAFAYNVYGYQLPNSVFDFDNFRLMTVSAKNKDLQYMSYHTPAIYAVLGTAFCLSNVKKIKLIDLALILMSIWIILLSGARQGLVTFVVVIFIWFILKDERVKIKNIISVGVLGVLFYVFLIGLESEAISKMFDSSQTIEGNMNRNIEYPMEVVMSIPIFGVGFGNYLNPYSFEWYPHNMLVEIIAEMGFFGLILLLGIVIKFCVSNRFSMKHRLPCGAYAVIIFIPYLLRAMISSHIGENFVVFVMLFILFANTPSSRYVTIPKTLN